jgi:hypothetical protein
MRESPLPRQGLSDVPTPLDPFGQSSRSLGGASAVGAAGGGATAAVGALALATGGASLAGSSSQPQASAASTTMSGSFDDWLASMLPSDRSQILTATMPRP